jgi:hypothetical protein
MSATTLTCVFEATYDWLNRAYPLQGGGIDWEAEPLTWEEIKKLAEQEELDSEDEEMGSSILVAPRDCDMMLKTGDIVLTTGPGGDVYFFRETANNS